MDGEAGQDVLCYGGHDEEKEEEEVNQSQLKLIYRALVAILYGLTKLGAWITPPEIISDLLQETARLDQRPKVGDPQ